MDLQRDGGVDIDADDDDEIPDWDIDDEDLNKMGAIKQLANVMDFLVPEIWKPVETRVPSAKEVPAVPNPILQYGKISEVVTDFECGVEQPPERTESEDPDAEKISDLLEDMRDGKPGPDTLKLFAEMDFSNPKVLSEHQRQSREFLAKANAALYSSKELFNVYDELSVNAKGELVVARYPGRSEGSSASGHRSPLGSETYNLDKFKKK
ncbi:MAG: hypothetical protein K2W95_06425 [Candidatus Obscuribacterales bacterium]|nr:hypothetical protein [Candidatus Obscuribacterales bacterium]